MGEGSSCLYSPFCPLSPLRPFDTLKAPQAQGPRERARACPGLDPGVRVLDEEERRVVLLHSNDEGEAGRTGEGRTATRPAGDFELTPYGGFD